jgi:hypothetical protein
VSATAAATSDDGRVLEKETMMELVPYFQCGSPPIENGHDAFLRVRVTKELEPNGSLTVYLPSGTALMVHGRDLLRAQRESGACESAM